MEGYVKRLMIQRQKGAPFCERARVHLTAGAGIAEDWHFGGGRAQVCLLGESCRRWMEEQEGGGLCLEQFRENLLLGGIRTSELKEGGRLSIGEVRLEITQVGKRCFAECERVKNARACLLKESCCFAAVVSGGVIHRGDPVCAEDGDTGTVRSADAHQDTGTVQTADACQDTGTVQTVDACQDTGGSVQTADACQDAEKIQVTDTRKG